MQVRPLFLWMIVFLCAAFSLSAQAPALIRGPYLQVASDTGIHIRWRTDMPAKSRVQWGLQAGSLPQLKDDTAMLTDHEVVLTGLVPATKYWYAVGSPSAVLQGNADNYFMTLPSASAKNLVRIGAFGDCGNNSINQMAVRDQVLNYLGTSYMNAWILLGDNAYSYGLDAEFQSGFFTIYQDRFLKQSPLFPAPGNHDYADNTTLQINHAIDYYSVFSMPVAAEAGGVPSANQSYYSFNVGNVHFLSLDSYGMEDGTTRLYDTTGKQVQWIKQDLEANRNKEWVVAYWHHPPYTKGSHNSDTENELISLRTNLMPVLERYGVDLVLCGHSHVYERSKLQKGHFGLEASFDETQHDLSLSSALYDGSPASCPYIKDTAKGSAGTVYVVSGSAGQVGGRTPGYPHNAMYYSNTTDGGAVMLEVEGNRLDAKWISADGIIRDRFTMMKGVNIKKALTVNAGDSVVLTASFNGSYQWTPGGATTKSIKVAPATNTTYYASDAYSCVSDTFMVNLINVPLPVAWGNIGGWYNKATHAVNLTWQTFQEQNSHHFIVERSVDAINFSPVTLIPASGNSATLKNYAYADAAIDAQRKQYYYRIRQVAQNGTASYSSVVLINLGAGTNLDVQVVPNPGRQSDIKIRMVTAGNGLPALLTITDDGGKIISSKQVVLSPSLQTFMPQVKAGVYFLTVKTNSNTSVIRLVIQ